MGGLDLAEASDTDFDIARSPRFAGSSPLGAGYLILVARELTGLSQRRLARTGLADFIVLREPSPFEGPV